MPAQRRKSTLQDSAEERGWRLYLTPGLAPEEGNGGGMKKNSACRKRYNPSPSFATGPPLEFVEADGYPSLERFSGKQESWNTTRPYEAVQPAHQKCVTVVK